ncbi:c-type cytochrome [Frigidibacter oleivorans]|uniref:c-type cytochrome n=1 Tax=Frigidibacter oleivorans TaxID=2487129 RepID=UPI000F8EA5B0|nr:cytochrome C [Frigidibacter oleivorans]
MTFRIFAAGLALALSTAAISVPALAQDAAKGETEFKKCKACHAITAPDGTDIVKGGKVGPNLYGVVGRPVASVPDFKYGDGILAVGAAGTVWDEATLAEYVTDPTAFIDTHGGSGKSKMTFKLAKNQADVVAYLASVAQ